MKEMIKSMVQEMVMQSIKEVMSDMFSTPESPKVAQAEALVDAVETLEDLLALDTSHEVRDLAREKKPLQLVPSTVLPPRCSVPKRSVKYNQYCTSKAVWQYNHLQIKKKYPTVKYYRGHYYCDALGDLQVFAGSYQVIEHLTDEQMAEVKAYWDSKKK